jgi:hypothetical protein
MRGRILKQFVFANKEKKEKRKKETEQKMGLGVKH